MSELNLNTIRNQPPGPASDFLSLMLKSERERLIDSKAVDAFALPYVIKPAYVVRVSTRPQAEADKVSLDEQEAKIKEFIVRNQWADSVRVYREAGVSGTKVSERELIGQIVEDAKAGLFDVLVAWHTDRLARNSEEMTALRNELRKYGVQVTSVCEPSEIVDPRKFSFDGFSSNSKLLHYIFDWKAEQDNKTRVERFNLGKYGKAKRGRIPCKTPYGYKKTIRFLEDDPKKRTEEDKVVPEQATVVQEIFNLYDFKSWGYRKIAEYLNIKRILSPTGSIWGYSTIKYTLQNPTYAGMVRFGWRLSQSKKSRDRLNQGHEGILVQGLQERIIEEEQFKRVSKKIEVRSKLGGRAVASKGLLVGIAKCGRCGSGTFVTHYNHWLAYEKTPETREEYTKTRAYMCSGYSQFGKSKCPARYVMTQDKLEGMVVSKIKELANSPQAREAFLAEFQKNNVKQIQSEIDTLTENMPKVEEKKLRQNFAYENGIVSFEEHQSDIQRLNGEIEGFKTRIAEKNKELEQATNLEEKGKNAILALNDFDKMWEQADFQRKKELLQSILKKVIVNKDSIEIEFAHN